jgi:hypothetical protein
VNPLLLTLCLFKSVTCDIGSIPAISHLILIKPIYEGITMNHISLKKLTLIVSTFALVSYFVSAKENELNLDLPAVEVSAVKAITAKAVSIDSLKSSEGDISTLFAKFDMDKNSLLNQAEILASKNELLSEHFADIDQNSDTEISKEELKNYFSAKTAQKKSILDVNKKS